MRRARYLLVIAMALGACGGDEPEPEPDILEVELAREVRERTGTELVLVTCPEDAGEGDICDVSAPGGVRTKLRITRIDGVEVDWKLVQP